ncbi:MAG TPA: PilC/PilY family type IV pilus protein [Thermoanaerobaculia bacterium]|jgi:hypothetical protein|nr:PilC/PilY family type IV pilus protein [Thermoanaerobaculia bacterium]
MVRQRPSLRGTAAAIAVLATLGLLAFGQRAYTDDVDLLRFTTAKPYVYFIIDNSASMNLAPDGTWVHGNGDDPRSKMYQVKKVVYDVFKDVNDIQFGFAAFNQDFARVTAKHWLYYYATSPSNKLPSDWPINYPAADNDGPIITAADGTVSGDIEGDLLTFGAHLGGASVLGTCTAPLPFGNVGADDRETINRFSKLGANGSSVTTLWIQGGSGNKTYRLTVERPGKKSDDIALNPDLGKDNMDVTLKLEEVKTSGGCTGAQTANFQQTYTARLELSLWTDFLMNDENNGRDVDDDTHSGGVDSLAGFWDAKDIQDVASCGSGHPFSGSGWEGNYDTSAAGSGAKMDPYCSNAADPATCYNLKRTTVTDPTYGAQRVLDKGDMLPFDWRAEQKTEFLQRFNPNHGSGTPNFGIASYFKKDADAVTGNLTLNTAGEIPLFASGPTPLGKSVIDFRCWYLGDDNKCKDDAYPTGWETLAGSKDSEWGCRKPYLIVISDGSDTCAGENPCADTASLKSKAGVQTWVIAYGADCAKTQNPLKCMAQNGDGQLLCPATANQLKAELEKILGLIRQEARSFASAAVPSVQAVVDDKIFLTNFTPLNAKAVWDGHVNAFFKPIPIKNGKPDTTATCPNADGNYSNCFAWDAAKVMLNNQVNPSNPTGSGNGQRRVYYARDSNEPSAPFKRDVPFKRQMFEATTNATDNVIRFDFWRGLGLGTVFDPTDTTQIANAQTSANATIANAFAVKTAVVDIKNPDGTTTPTTIQYVLGDVFHSNPLVVGNPPNVQYYALDLKGYQDFAEKHRLRRKILLVGANDGMLHAFDAGMYNRDKTKFKDKFDKGTGKEIFAYIPRSVLPTVKLINSPGSTNHQWSVDGTVTVADAFIDPKNGDAFGKPKDAQREWRTVALGGLREGGALVYALDITQPDKIDNGKPEEPSSSDYVPSCLNTPANVTDTGEDSFCGVLPFPSILWEFDDSVVTSTGERVFLDEEPVTVAFPTGGNNEPDLGETWSVPNVGRIRIAESAGSAATRDVHVAIFGGGLDPASKTAPQRGTWIYMVDIETGKAIYKRRLNGAMPSEPSAVDTNGDGYLDRIYVGTTAGRVYRIDLAAIDLQDPADPTDDLYPALANEMAWGDDDKPHLVERIQKTAWEPRMIFNASWDGVLNVATAVDRPIYFRPSVIFDAKLGTYLIAFGTGDRDDLWNNDGQTGRFYVFLDDTDKLSTGLPLTETSFKKIGVADTVPGTNLETLPVGQRGWYLVLDTNERVINDPFALSGVTFFSTYKPRVDVTSTKEGPQCSKTGISRIFIVSTLTANPFVQPPSGVTAQATRQFEVSNFVTNPFTEQRQTKNDTGTTTVKEICDDPTKIAIMESLKTLFPPTCKFGNYMVDIKTIASDTSLVCIAPVPVCLITKNWKEF